MGRDGGNRGYDEVLAPASSLCRRGSVRRLAVRRRPLRRRRYLPRGAGARRLRRAAGLFRRDVGNGGGVVSGRLPAQRGARSFALSTRGAHKATADHGLPSDIVSEGGIALRCNWTLPPARWGILGVGRATRPGDERFLRLVFVLAVTVQQVLRVDAVVGVVGRLLADVAASTVPSSTPSAPAAVSAVTAPTLSSGNIPPGVLPSDPAPGDASAAPDHHESSLASSSSSSRRSRAMQTGADRRPATEDAISVGAASSPARKAQREAGTRSSSSASSATSFSAPPWSRTAPCSAPNLRSFAPRPPLLATDGLSSSRGQRQCHDGAGRPSSDSRAH